MILNEQVGLLSFFTADYEALHRVVSPVKEEYCNRHGYRHIVKIGPYGDPQSYYAYSRLKYIRDLFWGGLPEGDGIEVILCMNGHAQVMNLTLTVQRLIDPHHDLYVAADPHGLNCGVMIFRKSPWLKGFLDVWLSLEQQYAAHSWHEQKALQDMWASHRLQLRGKIQLVDQRFLQTYLWRHYDWEPTSPGQFVKGDWIIHVPGKSTKVGVDKNLLESRIEIFSSPEILDNIVR